MVLITDVIKVFTPYRLLKGFSEGAFGRRPEGLIVLTHSLGAEFQELPVLSLQLHFLF
jgi:hypothetical protein